MTQIVVLDEIPFEPDLDRLAAQMRVARSRSAFDKLARLVEQARELARPKALYRLAYVESRGKEHVVVDGVRLRSRVLRVNLEESHRVFACLATAGRELEAWSEAIDDMLLRYYSERINEQALRAAEQTLVREIEERYRTGTTSSMSPGSLADWPIAAQRDLFSLLGNTEERIGVRLEESLLMTPVKTTSSIRFPTEEHFESCQLCPRQECPGRGAPYDPQLYEEKYRPAG